MAETRMRTPDEGAAERRQAGGSSRKDQNTSPKRGQGPNVKSNTLKCPDCDFTCTSNTDLNSHFQKTNHKQKDDGKSQKMSDKTETEKMSDKTERQKTETEKMSGKTERQKTSDKSEREKMSDKMERDKSEREKTRDKMERQKTRDNLERDKMSDKTERPKTRDRSEREKTSDTMERRKTGDRTENKKPEDPAPGVPGMVPDYIRKSLFVLEDYIRWREREPIIGLEYILEYKVQMGYDRIDTKYFCEICEMDGSVIPMVDHLCGFKHRKLYCGKEYPYVLKALFQTKEDKAVFMRRMAMEIEKEEGIKSCKTDPVIRMVSVMNVKSTEAKQSKRTTRWNTEGERQTKMRQALEFLDSYEIGSEDEATTISRLLENMTADLKVHTDKLKQEALFPAKLARAKLVGRSLVNNAAIEQMFQRHVKKMERERSKLGMPIGPFQPNPFCTPNTPFPQGSQLSPFNRNFNSQILGSQATEIDETDEDVKFLEKLMTMLEALPESDMETDDSELNSKLMMLKSMLLDDNVDNTPEDHLMIQIASLAQDVASMENASLNQQLNTMVSKNSATTDQFSPNLLMQMASLLNQTPEENAQVNQNSGTPMAAFPQNSQRNVNSFLPGNQNVLNRERVQIDSSSSALGQNSQRNVNSLWPEKHNVLNREQVQMDNNLAVLMGQTAYRPPNRDQQPRCSSSTRIHEDFGRDGRMGGKYENPNRNRYDNPAKSMVNMPNEPRRDLYADGGYEPDMYRRDWDESSFSSISRGVNQEFGDYRVREPYARIDMCHSDRRFENERFQDDRYNWDLRGEIQSHETRPNSGGRGGRPFDDPAWAERESDMYYGKRPKLDSGSVDADTSSLSVDLLKMIRGKDLFTVSEILSGYRQ